MFSTYFNISSDKNLIMSEFFSCIKLLQNCFINFTLSLISAVVIDKLNTKCDYIILTISK